MKLNFGDNNVSDKSAKQNDVERFWDETPCDSEKSNEDKNRHEYYIQIEKDRYSHQSHIKKIIAEIDIKGKKVLEIGTGVGTDARKMIEHGAIYTGINVDKGSANATNKALEIFGLKGKAIQCSATNMIFEDESFDIVYSFGVLHHIPDVAKAISEILRVLKPGGKLIVMVYNRKSINYYIEIMILRKIFLRLILLPGVINILKTAGFSEKVLSRHKELFSEKTKYSNEEWLSRNTDGPDNPFSRVYNYNELNELLSDFNIELQKVYFFDYTHWGIFGNVLPKFLINILGSSFGWHRMAYAVKRLS